MGSNLELSPDSEVPDSIRSGGIDIIICHRIAQNRTAEGGGEAQWREDQAEPGQALRARVREAEGPHRHRVRGVRARRRSRPSWARGSGAACAPKARRDLIHGEGGKRAGKAPSQCRSSSQQG
eukprot:6199080-Pleurochrysis_carterae.AAC.1